MTEKFLVSVLQGKLWVLVGVYDTATEAKSSAIQWSRGIDDNGQLVNRRVVIQ
jgi:hypothetical protein